MVYTVDKVDDFIDLIIGDFIHKKGTQKKYFSSVLSFDIETSSLEIEGEKVSNMYIWQVAYQDNVLYGRYWKDFISFIAKLHARKQTTQNNRIIIYVHNLSYEFQFIYKFFPWLDVFAISERKPIYACTSFGIEFRCSFILSGYKLETLAKNLHDKKYSKLVGELDYTLIRHNDTELTKNELDYCFNDVLIVTQYIKEQIEEYGDITKVPLTQTGKVRNYVKKECFKNPSYKYFIKDLTLERVEYENLLLCYSGGFTHSSVLNTDVVIENVSSYDFTSSYPYVMLSEKYPIGKGKKVEITSINQALGLLVNYCCLFTARFTGVKPKFVYESILQYSKCYDVENPILNNGRIVSCDKCTIVLNEIDFYNLNNFYTFEHIEVSDFYVYEKDYLPREIIESILTLYEKKTELKGVEGKEKEYLNSKEMLNSIYGMCVTNTMKEHIIFDGVEWKKDTSFNINESIDKYNNDKSRFLFYPWGVWVTSYARRNLLNGVLNIGRDYIYSDTDSIKLTNRENHLEYFTQYNDLVKEKLYNMCKHYDIDFSRCEPKTIKGVKKLLGVWDYEGTYSRFKTLGAKKYMIEENGNYSITVAGLPKKAIDYIMRESKRMDITPFSFFHNDMYIPENFTGKLTHTYIDTEKLVEIKDYLGNVKKVLCKSGVHLEKCDFTINMSDMYIDYIVYSKQIIQGSF